MKTENEHTGDNIDARNSKGFINKPGGPVIQHFAIQMTIGVAAILALGLVVAFGVPGLVGNIPVIQNLLPTPTAFAPAQADESLIIVAEFDDRSAGQHAGIAPDQYIYEHLRDRVERDGLDIRVERLYEVVDDNTARQSGEIYSATLVLWGWYDALTVTPRLERIKGLRGDAADEEGQRVSLIDPERIVFNVVTDLPALASYLTLFTLGADQYAVQAFDAARAYLTSAVNAIPPNQQVSANPDEAYFLRGLVNYDTDDFAQAVADNTQAIELAFEPLDWAYNNRGIAAYALGQYDQALADYNQVLDRSPRLARVYYNRGLTYAALGQYAQAIADYNQALTLNPQLAEPYHDRGLTYAALGQYAQAIADYNQALTLNPRFARAYNNRASIYADLDQYDQALADYNQALDLNPEFAEAYYNRGLTYADLQQYDRALADYDQALALNPEFAEAYHDRGNAYYALGQYDQAITDYDQALALNSQYASAYYNRGLAYAKLGAYAQAIANYDQALALGLVNPSVYTNRGTAHTQQGNYDQALADFEAVTRLAPDSPQGHNALCWWGSLSGSAAEVAAACDQAVRLAPGDAAMRDSRGLNRALTGDYAGAIADFKAFVAWARGIAIENEAFGAAVSKREQWIAVLEAGDSPFDAATLEELRKE